ncbi:hypothetical protein BpHYR1_037451 [Brachionus plicatilis]|uniref:Uncharacterized protein n=1 Tax=Brachionus plicatilis TaxID=10195 RepID=A0A3M7SFE2_BRAPC|nr:hypothetical protein BpHYR1_037451 [Brachionus plicatilis]
MNHFFDNLNQFEYYEVVIGSYFDYWIKQPTRVLKANSVLTNIQPTHEEVARHNQYEQFFS